MRNRRKSPGEIDEEVPGQMGKIGKEVPGEMGEEVPGGIQKKKNEKNWLVKG